MAATEYKGYRIEPSETSGKWRASIRRSDDLEIRVGTGRYKSFRTGEFPTEREAIERAHKLDRQSRDSLRRGSRAPQTPWTRLTHLFKSIRNSATLDFKSAT